MSGSDWKPGVVLRLRCSRFQRIRWIGWMLFLRRWFPFGTFAR